MGVPLGPETTGLRVVTTIRLQPIPTGVYHLLDPQTDPLLTVTVKNESHEPKRICVTAYLEGLSARAIKTIELARAAQARVVLLGMLIPPNYGQRYAQEFRDMFSTLASSHSIALVPFLLDKVALNPRLMQDDGIHANAKGQPQMLENVWPTLKPLLVAPRKPAS